MEDLFQKEIERSEKVSTLWKRLQKEEVHIDFIPLEEKEFYIEKLEKLMSDEQEKWRDKEGEEFYGRVVTLIEKLR